MKTDRICSHMRQYDRVVERCSILDRDPFVFCNQDFLPEVCFIH